MTVTNSTYRADYTGNGSTVDFTVPFYFLDTSHIQVLLTVIATGVATTLTLNSDYTVTGAGVSAGGTVTTTATYTSSYKITILRDVPYTQETHYVENDPFPAASHEKALDLLTMQNQQQAELLTRAFIAPSSGTVTDLTLPTPTAGYVLGWDGTGTGIVNVVSGAGSGAALQADLASTASTALGDALVGVKSALTGGVARTQHSKNAETVSILDFGSITGTDDTAVWTAMVAAVNAGGIGTLLIPPGLTVVVSFAPSTYANAVKFKNVTGLQILGYGSTLKVKTGTSVNSTQYSAHLLMFENCTNVRIAGLSLDGNAGALSYAVGTYDGAAMGVATYGCANLALEDMNISNAGTDCIYISDGYAAGLGAGLNSKRVALKRVYATVARRHAITLSQCLGFTAENCEFSGGQYAGGTAPSSGMGASMDIEPNGTGGYVKDARFTGCVFGTSGRASLIAATYQAYVDNVVFDNCRFENTLNTAVLANANVYTFVNCAIHGEMEGFPKSLKNCDLTVDGTVYSGSANSFLFGGDYQTVFDDCNFYANGSQRFVDVGGSTTNRTAKYFRNCRFTYTGNAYADNGHLCRFLGVGEINNCYFAHLGTPPATKYDLQINGDQTTDLSFVAIRCFSDTPIKFYFSGTGNASVGNYRDAMSMMYLLQMFSDSGDPTAGVNQLIYLRSAMPSSGTWVAGTLVLNSGVTVSGSGGYATANQKYILLGWKRITSGAANVLNTDWVEMRTLTGA